ncbi:MAG: hypothetical protein KAW46_00445 [candidate division Zixibacteria bacterium]|nr:hypothetical protein [candidate division Zixibacteria bacterium]
MERLITAGTDSLVSESNITDHELLDIGAPISYTENQLLNIATAATTCTDHESKWVSADHRATEVKGAVICNRYFLVLIPTFLLLSASARTQGVETGSPGDSVRFRTYVALEYVEQSMPDGFDGWSFYSDGINLFTVPKLEAGSGLRVSLGFRKRHLGGEVSYTTTSHQTTWLGIQDRARHHELGANAKGYLNPNGLLQPFGMVGLLLHFLVLNNGAIDLDSDSLITVRETFGGGIGLRVGGGLRLRISSTLALRSEAGYRIGRFRTLAGRRINSFSAGGWNFSTGVIHTFKR